MQVSYQGWQNDGEAGDEELGNELRHDDAEDEEDLAPEGGEDRRAFAAETLYSGL